MNTLTVKIPDALEREIDRIARRKRISKSELVRRATEQYLARNTGAGDFQSALDLAGSLVGCLHGAPANLASGRRHLSRYGG
jgi:Arc/MetJ-type ribon-helix-helix transcriptional regulator